MKKFRGIMYLLFVAVMITSPLLISVEASFSPAQTTTPTFSGELIPDPYFAEEPYVEIGDYSPEFDYEYTTGSVSLIWMHTAGYQLDYSGYYPYTNCDEFARVQQLFIPDFNDTVQSVRISADIKVDCTGDFASQDIRDSMWEVSFGLFSPYSGSLPIRTITDLKNGDDEEIAFLLSDVESGSFSYGGILSGEYGLTLQLSPSFLFGQTLGNSTPWMDYSGSVILTVTHMSFELMIEGESLAPPIRTPKHNTTLLTNETSSLIVGIESAGYDQLYAFRQDQTSGFGYTLHTLASSNHHELRNRTIYEPDPYSYVGGIYNFATNGDRIIMGNVVINSTPYGTDYDALIQNVDSFGNSYWNTTVNLYYQDIPLYVDFDDSGNVFVYILSLNSPTDIYDPYDQTIEHSIVMLDNIGNWVWNITFLTQNYYEFIALGTNPNLPTGFGSNGNSILLGMNNKIYKFNSVGGEVWSQEYNHDALCVDPQGGFYTFTLKHGVRSELTRFDTNGNAVWTNSLGWDYGSDWIEYPNLRTMIVSPSGPLHLVLDYTSIEARTVLTRITREGALASQDSLFEGHFIDYGYPTLPRVSDIAITGDGLVHITGSTVYYPYIVSPLLSLPGDFLVTYELPEIAGIPTFTPISLTMVGIASVLIIGIAYDFFFRRGSAAPVPPAEPSISDFEW